MAFVGDYRTDYRTDYADYRRGDGDYRAAGPRRAAGAAGQPQGLSSLSCTQLVSCAAISLAAFVYCVGQGATGPAVAELLLERACATRNLTYPSANCTSSVESQSDSSRRLSYYNLACSLPALLTVAWVSMVADARGRKMAAVVPYTGSLLAGLAVAALPDHAVCADWGSGGCVDSFTALVVLTAVASASGGYFSVLSFSFAVIGDVTEGVAGGKLRTYLFAILETALMTGYFVGPALGGELARRYTIQRSLYFPVAMYGSGLVMILLAFTDTLDRGKRAPFSWGRANPFGAMWMLLDNRISMTLAIIVLLSNASGGSGSVLPLYLGEALGYGPFETGWFQAAGQAGAAAGLLLVLPLLQRCLSTKWIVSISVGTSTLSGFGGALGAAALQYSFWRGWPGATALPYALNAVGGILTIIWYPCMRSVMSEQQPPGSSASHGAFAGSG